MNWQGRGNWQETVETALKGLGYELVDAERSVGGLLRVTIDHLLAGGELASSGEPAAGTDVATGERFITVDDCERATRQLQHVLEVEGVDYQRLEVSSPGLDRPLKRAADYARFAGHEVELTLKAPFQGRKRWQGELQPNGDGWRLVLPSAPDAAPNALEFNLDEVREAHLVPVIDFKGRRRGAADAATEAARGEPDAAAPRPARKAAAPRAGVDGGRIR